MTESETKWTPGPWHWDAGDVGVEPGVLYADIYTDDEAVIAMFNINLKEGTANARLIAAAPDLYAALERTLSWLTSYQGSGSMADHGPYNQARAALAKARGERLLTASSDTSSGQP